MRRDRQLRIPSKAQREALERLAAGELLVILQGPMRGYPRNSWYVGGGKPFMVDTARILRDREWMERVSEAGDEVTYRISEAGREALAGE
jgi:hypothetical protein